MRSTYMVLRRLYGLPAYQAFFYATGRYALHCGHPYR